MNIDVFTTLPLEVLRDRFSQVEAVSGWKYDDIIRGDDRTLFSNIELEIEEEDEETEDPEDETMRTATPRYPAGHYNAADPDGRQRQPDILRSDAGRQFRQQRARSGGHRPHRRSRPDHHRT